MYTDSTDCIFITILEKYCDTRLGNLTPVKLGRLNRKSKREEKHLSACDI